MRARPTLPSGGSEPSAAAALDKLHSSPSGKRCGSRTFITLAGGLLVFVFILVRPPPARVSVAAPPVELTPVISSAPPPPPLIQTQPNIIATQPQQTQPKRARVALIMLVVGSNLPAWWPFLVATYARNRPTYQLIVVHTGLLPSAQKLSNSSDVRYEHIPLAALQQRFVTKLGASPKLVDAKFASGKGLSDLKPLYGRIFDELLDEALYTHWGWVDWDLLLGDLNSVIPEALLWAYDALTFPGATLGFAWAGQLSILRNTNEGRTLFTVVPNFLELSLKTGTGEARQSGWEERVFLKETLKARPAMKILFHMAAQFDYKAQWLTWVPFDHFWRDGKVWRCAKLPLYRKGRPPLLVSPDRYDHSHWMKDVEQIRSDPFGFQNRKDGRVCIRWDLESSPWRCCPHSMGVAYVAQGEKSLTPLLYPYNNATSGIRVSLAKAAVHAATRPRESSYDVCQEGGFFHAGLLPKGGIRPAPSCIDGTWALQDDIGRFSGTITLLEERCAR